MQMMLSSIQDRRFSNELIWYCGRSQAGGMVVPLDLQEAERRHLRGVWST